MKNILIPTDFSLQSLKLIHAAVKKFNGQRLKIHLVHALETENSISDLLFFKKRLRANFLCSEKFVEACEVIKNKYESIISNIQIEFYFGQSNIYKKNFLEARNIDAIMLPLNYSFEKCSPASIDPLVLWNVKFVHVIHETMTEVTFGSKLQEFKTEQMQYS